MPNHEYNGTMYRINEHILSKYDTSEELIVVRILNIVSLNLQGEYKMFIKGEAYTQALTVTGDSRFHEYSDNPFVEPPVTVLFIPVSGIVRKVMLILTQNIFKIHTATLSSIIKDQFCHCVVVMY